MHFGRGNCGHLKAKWDNHPSCLSCTTCLRNSPCCVCSALSNKVWNLAENRRLHATRKSVMTQRRKQKKNKKNKKSIKSDSGVHDGSTALLSYSARSRTHQGGSPGDQASDRALPVTSQLVPVNQSPAIQSLVIQSTVNQSLVSRSLVNQSPVIQSPVIQSPVNQSPVDQSLVNQAPVNQAPVNQASVISHLYLIINHL